MFQNIPRDKVFEAVVRRGPVIPIDLVKELGGDTLILGAVLSELASAKKILISNTKKGGSPFYYVPQQFQKLEALAVYLNEKDRRAFDLLKEKKVLKDTDLDPLTRVCLRSIKDFATPHPVGEELYWKYYLLSDHEAQAILDAAQRPVEPQPAPVQSPVPAQPSASTARPGEPVPQPAPQPVLKRRPRKPKTVPAQQTLHSPAMPSQQATPQPAPEFIPQGFFQERVLAFFKEKNIIVETTKKIGKSEIDFTIDVPSSIGRAVYYCKAKDKKRINDGDIALASLQGQQLKLPVLLLITGELTKRATEMLGQEFKNVNIVVLNGNKNQ